jgi:hypothetical protein
LLFHLFIQTYRDIGLEILRINYYEVFLLQGIEFLRKLTEGQVIDAQKTIPLKDNSGHYGNLFMGDICLNEQVKEQGYAYLRPAMSSNTLKSINKTTTTLHLNKTTTTLHLE